MEHNIFKNLTQLVGDKPVGYFTSVVEDLNSKLLKTKSASGSERDLNSGIPNYKSSALTARPRYLGKVFSRSRLQ